ncbi:hypothetical protein C5Z25_11675 [Lactobacillus sp. CBA3605]|nr:hypothetical protein C5Z25_11675 [Lactobacillus sp. CBA3605]
MINTSLGELHEAKLIDAVPNNSDLTPEMLDAVISMVEDRSVALDDGRGSVTQKGSPNPAKQQRRALKAKRNVS